MIPTLKNFLIRQLALTIGEPPQTAGPDLLARAEENIDAWNPNELPTQRPPHPPTAAGQGAPG